MDSFLLSGEGARVREPALRLPGAPARSMGDAETSETLRVHAPRGTRSQGRAPSRTLPTPGQSWLKPPSQTRHWSKGGQCHLMKSHTSVPGELPSLLEPAPQQPPAQPGQPDPASGGPQAGEASGGGGWGVRAGQEVEEGQQRSIRIRKGVSVAAVKGLQSEWEPGMTVSRSKLMIM